ncbi:MAG: 6-bladed beta-propeller [Marinifilaceae bacterium]
MIKYVMLICALIIGLVGCKEGDEFPTLDVVDAKIVSVHDVLEKMRFIPLETSAECLLGDVREVIVEDTLLFIPSREIIHIKEVYVFSTSGKFLRSIGCEGNGPGEYVNAISSTVDKERKEVLIMDISKNCLLCYDYDGNYIETRKLNNVPNHATNMQWLDKGRCGFIYPIGIESQAFQLFMINGSGEKVAQVGMINNWAGESWYIDKRAGFRQTKNNILALCSFNDTLYQLNDGCFEPLLFMKTPNTFVKQMSSKSYLDVISDISIVMGRDNGLFFQYNGMPYLLNMNAKNELLCIADMQDKCFLSNWVGTNGNSVLGMLRPEVLRDIAKDYPEWFKGNGLDIDRMNEDGNPVICVYEFK